MGNRISIQFEKDGKKSVVVFCQYGGQNIIKFANDYIKKLKKELNDKESQHMPGLNRLEPELVMIDFIRYAIGDKTRKKQTLYCGIDERDGDNSDNGHFIIKL